MGSRSGRFVFGASYPLPPQVVVREQLELPATLAGNKLALHFVRDKAVGVALTAIEQGDGESSFSFRVGLPPDGIVVATSGEVQDGGLWAMHLTTQTGTKVRLRARDAQRFAGYRATGLDGEPALLFVWGDVPIPGAPDYDQLGVMVLVSLAAGDEVSRWQAWVARARGASASIDALELPILAVRCPVAARSGETHFDAQKRGRFLLPSFVSTGSGLVSTNTPLWLWLVTLIQLRRGQYGARHPNPEQGFQFCVMYAADPSDTASFRRMLYCGSEDRTGYYKEFLYGGALVAVNSDIAAYWTWSAMFVPSFQDPVADPDQPAATEWGNAVAMPYPAVVGALRAKTDAFWYDAGAYYRSFVDRAGIGGLRAHDRRTGLLGTTDLFSASIQTSTALWRGPALYQRILELHRLWLRIVDNPFVSTATSHMHMQTYRVPDVFLGNVADEPLDLTIAEGVREMLADALALGVRASPYTYPGSLARDSSWVRHVVPEAEAYRRDGEPLRFPDVDGLPRGPTIDFGSEPGQRFFPCIVLQALTQDVGFGGVYNDLLSGGGALLTYDPSPPYAPQHPAHGGDYWMRGKARVLDLEREVLQRFGPGGESDRLRRSFVASEGPEEFAAPHLDVFQDGYDWIPGTMLLAEESAYGRDISSPQVPMASKDMSPPLWNLVYHEWAPSARFLLPLTNAGFARNARFYPDGPYPGMQAFEVRDLMCFLFASNFVFGLSPTYFYHTDQDYPLLVVKDGELAVDRDVDPEGVGLVIADFLRTLFSAQEPTHAGRFCRTGRMERPLQVDWTRHPELTCRNPIEACIKTPPKLLFACYPFPYDPVDVNVGRIPGFQWGTLPFQVPCVPHTMWRSPQGELGLVLTNWTAALAPWIGVFDPTLYGYEPDQTLRVVRLVQGEVGQCVGTFTGTIALACNGSRHASLTTLDLGELTAHAVGIFMFVPQDKEAAA